MIEPGDMRLEAWALREGRFSLVEVASKEETYPSPLVGKLALNALFGA